MKTFHLFRVAPVVLLMTGWGSGFGFGQVPQHTNVNGAAGVNAPGGNANANGSASGNATVPAAQMPAELATKVDSKTAKAGDAVEAKTTKTVTMADGTVIPKGSKLIGTVTSAQAHEKGQAESRLALSFDRVRLRGGQEVMLRSSIDNVSNPVGMSAEGDVDIDDMIGVGPMAASGGGVARGGLGAGGVVGGATGSVVRTGNALGSSAQGTVQGSNALLRGTAEGVDGTANAAATTSVSGAKQGSAGLMTHATNVQGVMLSGSAAEGTSSVLSAAGKNVHLDSGTQMMLSVAAQK